jgi:hypothetical protein
MAKELPYFKFEPAAWDTGKIQMCSFEAQGIFIGVCSMYWQRLGNLPYKLALQKVCGGNATALQSLCDEGAIKVIDEMICIDFLNEQLDEFGHLSKTNSENARNGWEKRRKNATALPPQSDRNAIREEKRRGDKRIEEENNTVAGKPATLEERALGFQSRVAEYLSQYPKEMLRSFYDYWTEKNEGGRKFRFEMQKVFDMDKRLRTWKANDDKRKYGNGKQQITAEGTLNRANSYRD